jgi:hypothetical protein
MPIIGTVVAMQSPLNSLFGQSEKKIAEKIEEMRYRAFRILADKFSAKRFGLRNRERPGFRRAVVMDLAALSRGLPDLQVPTPVADPARGADDRRLVPAVEAVNGAEVLEKDELRFR